MKDEMPENEGAAGKEKRAAKVDLSSLDFQPDWSKSGAGSYRQPRRGEERGRKPRRNDERRPPRRQERRPREDRAGDSRPFSRPRREFVEPLALDVRFLPDQQRLANLVRQLHGSGRAYPLVDLARRFMEKPQFNRIKLEPAGNTDIQLFQCKICQLIDGSEELIRTHMLREHMTDFFEMQEEDVEPPSGNFVCVARCKLSGELLGPPNHHSFNEKLQALHQSRFAHMPLEEYRAKIETVHDETLVEEWKQACSRQVFCRLKEQGEDAVKMTLPEAEKYFIEQIAPRNTGRSRRMIMPGELLPQINDQALVRAIQMVLQKERKFPYTLMLALRAGFRHMKLYMFKCGGKFNFVSSTEPAPLDKDHVVDEIKKVIEFIENNPGKTRQEIIEAVTSEPQGSEGYSKLITEMAWLVDKGHIIEFFDGTCVLPHQLRKYIPAQSKDSTSSISMHDTPAEETAVAAEPEQEKSTENSGAVEKKTEDPEPAEKPEETAGEADVKTPEPLAEDSGTLPEEKADAEVDEPAEEEPKAE